MTVVVCRDCFINHHVKLTIQSHNTAGQSAVMISSVERSSTNLFGIHGTDRHNVAKLHYTDVNRDCACVKLSIM